MEQRVEENRKTLIRALLLPYSKYASRSLLRRRHPLVARLIQFTSKPSDSPSSPAHAKPEVGKAEAPKRAKRRHPFCFSRR
jgi:hypothetical protein